MSNQKILIQGFGVITVKLAMSEMYYFRTEMQSAYRVGNLSRAILMMQTMRPFVDALRKAGYTTAQILGE